MTTTQEPDTQEASTIEKMRHQHSVLQEAHGYERIAFYPDDSIEREFIDEDAKHCIGKRRAQHGYWRQTEQGWERFWPVLWREVRV